MEREVEKELMDALAPDYSQYMFNKAQEWANVDGDSSIFYSIYEGWDDYHWMEEVEWEKYNGEHNSHFTLKEVA